MIKHKINLAVYFDQELSAGGGYQQALNSLLLLKKLNNNLLQVNYYTDKKSSIKFLINHEINTKLIKLSLIEKIERKIRLNIKSLKVLSFWKLICKYNSFEKYFIEDNIDLIYFLSPSPLAAELEKINYIITIWDNCHRDHPEFPEVRESLIFEQRERMYNKILPKAFSILVDSNLGKQNIIRRYGIDDQKIYIMPFTGALMSKPNEIDFCESYISDKYDLQLPYVFYPAQFWPHKNHILILEALNYLEQKYGI
jgi:glycosyltransferase involved in cell wall biosynthesis